MAWHYQTVHHDIWDFDVPAQPTFVDLTINGKTRPAVVQVTKMGMTFVLDRETGEPLHPVEERPVPQMGAVAGEYLSPTQPFPVKPEPLHPLGLMPDDAWGLTFWDRGQCRDIIESVSGHAIYTPPSEQGVVLYPSNLGGHNWGAPAVDPERKVMITNTKRLPVHVRLAPQAECPDNLPFPQVDSPYCCDHGCADLQPGHSLLCSTLGHPGCDRSRDGRDTVGVCPWVHLKKMVPWPFYHLIEGGMEMGGPMVTAAGLVFIAATSDAYLRAFDIESGNELWKGDLPATGNAVPMSYQYRGQQYVVIAAGGHFTSPLPSGDYLVAFRLSE